MRAGDWYCCLDDGLEAMRRTARRAVFTHGRMDPGMRGAIAPELRALLGAVGQDAIIEAPFHCSYGVHITLGDAVYLNTGCVILDSARVSIGARSMLGPGVQIYCADHHRDPALRAKGIERGLPVEIGTDVWIGGGATILPGLRVGDGAIIGAGALVTKDVAAGATVVGNPARPVG